MKLSVIVPVLNEESAILESLKHIQMHNHATDIEVIVVDGGSKDNTPRLAQSANARVIKSEAGRGVQLRNAAQHATGDILLFLHVDTTLPMGFDKLILESKQHNDLYWGFFKLKLSGRQLIFRLVEKMISLRSSLSRVATGDQCLFISRQLYHKVDGFKPIPLMEDIDICRRLKQQSRPYVIHEPVITSSRRWEHYGVTRTIMLMWWLRLLFFMGVSPHRLKVLYG